MCQSPFTFWRNDIQVVHLNYSTRPFSFPRLGQFLPPQQSSIFLTQIFSKFSYATWSIVGFVFNYLIKRRHGTWWAKYKLFALLSSNGSYVTSAGLDCGLAISLIVIFLTLSLPKAGIALNWWGNVAVFNTAVITLIGFELTQGF